MTSQKLDCGGGGSERAQFCKTYADKSIMVGATDIDRWTIQLIKRFTDRQKQTDKQKKQTDSRLADFQNRQKERQTEKQAQIVNRQTNRSEKQFRETGY